MSNTYPNTPPNNRVFLNTQIADVSTASSGWVVPGFRGKVKKMHCVLSAGLTVADAVLTLKVNSTAVTNGTLTLTQSGSAAGSVFSVTVPSNSTNSFDSNDALQIATDGGSTTTSIGVITLELEPT